MSKKIFAFAFAGLFLLVAFSSFSSAAYYGGYFNPNQGYGYGNDYYDSYSSWSSRTSGYGGFVTTKTTNYDRVNEKYWDGHDFVERTTYVQEKRETPQYGGYGSNYGYGGYQGNYYSQKPWYKKYWEQPAYDRNYYGGYLGYGY
ncbi:MAG: hypothetical protein KJ600_02700 [Nanoarchaeota archaeon]|nr:hypothetical protein [Nanoarchaeota archaeon]MBU1103439.1 hypothetical protein [Nanoarchaeota archaeon]MBU1911317.1 hypothetical protein [Patescibacteria group bacterium]